MFTEQQAGFRVYENRAPCQKIAVTTVIVHTISFCMTWYKVWWESVISILVGIVGTLATYEPIDHSKTAQATVFYYGSILALGSQIVAFGLLLYFLFESHFLESALGVSDFGSSTGLWAFFIGLLSLVVVHIALSGYSIYRAQAYLSELFRNNAGQHAYTEVTQSDKRTV